MRGGKQFFSSNLLNMTCHPILLLNVHFAFAVVRPGWRVTLVSNTQLLHRVENMVPRKLPALTPLLCGGLQNVLKVTEHDALLALVVLSVFQGLLS